MKIMSEKNNAPKIKIEKDGPYTVSGNVPLGEKIIKPKGKGFVFVDGRTFEHEEVYCLCRCGETKDSPFCDGTHKDIAFDGTETARNCKYEERAELLEGIEIDLRDDSRCAFARFCHREKGDVWELTENSYNDEMKNEAIIAASECPSGRLVAYDKTGKPIEPELKPSIEVMQDPEKNCSSGLYVKGGIPIESASGEMYEVRNRVVLCRCGESENKPFCDASHVMTRYSDEKQAKK
jgi:CDGSH-type Zn-finger protein